MTRKSHTIDAILEVTRKSAVTKDTVRIMELSSLDQLIPLDVAEGIRAQMLANKVQVRQLTTMRMFGPWTGVDGFVEKCMGVRYVSARELPIDTEVLLFDATLAFYRLHPDPFITVIESIAIAAQAKAWFDYVWLRAVPLKLNPDGSTRVR